MRKFAVNIMSNQGSQTRQKQWKALGQRDPNKVMK